MASGSADNNKDSRWYFTVEQLRTSPSRSQGIDADKELDHRQQAAHLIQDMGQRLRVNQLCINTAIVYMHRFYAFHSFTQFHHNGIAMASLFLAAKVEEQPRKLESVIQVAQMCLNIPSSDATKEYYQEQAQDLVFNENVLLQTLGFDVAVDHPHTHVVRTCQLVKACKDLAQTSYFLASNSLHLTTMCLQYRPTVVACFCIHLACKWSRWEIPQSTEGKDWFHYVDKSVSMELLEQLTDEFIQIYERSPARLKSKLSSTIKDLSANTRTGDRGETSSRQHSSSGEHSRSSSSHPRSSSSTSSNHHQTKQALSSHSSGDPMAKAHSSHPSSHGSHQKISGASANPHSSRHRTDRAERPVPPQGAGDRINYPTAQRSSSSSNSMASMSRSGTVGSGPSGQPRPSSHAVNDAANYARADPSKARMMPHPHASASHQRGSSSTSSSLSSSANKIDQRHTQIREQKLGPDGTHKSLSKSMQQGQLPSQNSNAMYPAVSTADVNRSSSSSARHQQQPGYLQSSSNFNQNMSRSNPMHPEQPSVQSQQLKRPSTMESSYRLTDDITSIKSLDNMDLLSTSPPRQALTSQSNKAPSIFSPEWNEKPAGSNGNGDEVAVFIKQDSKQEKLFSGADLNKNDIRSDHYNMGKNVLASDKRTSNAKRPNDNTGLHASQAALFDGRNDNKSSSKRNFAMEFGSNDAVDNKDFKIRKLDSPSNVPPMNLVEASMNLGPNNMNSISSFDDLQSSKSYNGIETNPDLVRNLLKESLFNENSSKFVPPQQMHPQQQYHQQQQEQRQQQQQQQQQRMQPQYLRNPAPQQEDSFMMNGFDEAMADYDSQQSNSFFTHAPAHLPTNVSRPMPPQLPPQLQPQLPLQLPLQLPPQLQLNADNSDADSMHLKSEKKKKKEKHKNKDKSKEERKKHKKDKDRHKDKDRDAELPKPHEPLKLKIKTPTQPIPSTHPTPQEPPQGLKIKISKDMVSNYNNSQILGSHSKKKDKHRDREKDKATKALPNTSNKIQNPSPMTCNDVSGQHYSLQQHQQQQLHYKNSSQTCMSSNSIMLSKYHNSGKN